SAVWPGKRGQIAIEMVEKSVRKTPSLTGSLRQRTPSLFYGQWGRCGAHARKQLSQRRENWITVLTCMRRPRHLAEVRHISYIVLQYYCRNTTRHTRGTPWASAGDHSRMSQMMSDLS